MIKRLLVTLSAIALLVGGSAVASEKYGWNPEKGKKLYIGKIKKQLCRKMAVKKFTQSYTQKEWKEMIANGTFIQEVTNICPDFGKNDFSEKQIADLGDAVINYARDSYNIPS